MPRLFVAIDLPPTHRDRIQSLSTPLPGARWTPAEQIHLTLRFIGEADDTLFRQIVDTLTAIRAEPLTLRIVGLGHFHLRHPPRVLWVGLEKSDQLLQLRNRIETALVQIGLEPEGRIFSPHITIARLRDPPLSLLTAFMATNNHFELPPFPVKEFQLYASKLSSTGATHYLEASYPLQSAESG